MEKMRYLTRRTRSGTLEDILREVNQYTRGWMAYFRLATTPSVYQELDEWTATETETVAVETLETGDNPSTGNWFSWECLTNEQALGAIGTSPWRMAHSPRGTRSPEQRFLALLRAGKSGTVRYNQLRYSR